MKVAFNFSGLYPGKIGGMEQFIRNTVKELGRIKGVEVHAVLKESLSGYFSDSDKVIRKVISARVDFLVAMKEYLISEKIDILICPFCFQEPKYLNIPVITIFPDTQCFDFPHFFEKNDLEARKNNFFNAVENSDLILTISKFSKGDMIKYGKTESERIDYVYLDADEVFYKTITEQKSKQVRKKYSLPEKYIFYPANTWEHKNHLTLLEAYSIFLSRNKGSDIKMVFTGDQNKFSEKVKSMIAKNNLSDKTMFLGYLAQEDMPYIYSNAQFMVFPSLYEGFGIPIVEAMRSECAVACSNAGSLPEIALDCVLYFDPNSAEEIADRIEQLMDKDLRAELTAKGEQRARDFSWKISAEKLCEIMRSLVAAHEDRKKKNRPLVSIVTPSYNQGEFIEETILSVLNQTYDNIEYIVMDGGSKDNTVDILKKYSDKITWVSEKDNGQAHAVDKGIKASKGEIIGWLNSDDTFYPEAVEVMVDYFTKYKDISVIYGEGDYTKKDSSFLCKYTTYDFSRDVLESECYICQPSTFFTRKIYDKVGGIDQSLQMCMDYELWIRMAQETDFLHIQDTIATSRLYDENKTLGQRDRVYNEIIFALQRHYGRVHIKWAYGYAHYLTELKKRRKSYMYFKFLYFLIRYNIKSPGYIFEALGTVCRHAYRRFSSYSKFKGVYADSFIAADFESNILVGNPKEMIIAGSNIFFNNVGLEVMVNNNVIASITVGKGDFEKRIKLPDGLKNSEINVKLRADRSKLMIFRSRGKDMRRVSLKLTNLSFTEVGNNE